MQSALKSGNGVLATKTPLLTILLDDRPDDERPDGVHRSYDKRPFAARFSVLLRRPVRDGKCGEPLVLFEPASPETLGFPAWFVYLLCLINLARCWCSSSGDFTSGNPLGSSTS